MVVVVPLPYKGSSQQKYLQVWMDGYSIRRYINTAERVNGGLAEPWNCAYVRCPLS